LNLNRRDNPNLRRPTKEESSKYRLNDRITALKVRLVGDDFDKISEVAGYDVDQGIYNTRLAVKWAQDLEMYLI